jgi:hypothetical protein
MSKQAGLFRMQNNDWVISETEVDVFELATADGAQKITSFPWRRLATAQGVLAEMERYMKEKGGK